MRRIVYAVITASVAVGVMLPAAASASAPPIKNTSSGCKATKDCQGEGLMSPGLALAVPSGAAKRSPVLVATPSAKTDTQDFVLSNPNDAPTAIEWAPNAKLSGLCVSEPSTASGTGLQLRKCNGSAYQIWYPTDYAGTGNAFNAWKNKAAYLAMTDPNNGGSGTQLVSGPLGTAPNEEWEAIA
jgi:hypothetical protein